MATRAFSESETSGPAPADNNDGMDRAITVLQTAEQVAGKVREEAREEAQRLIAEAREEADRIRADARGDAPELERATEQLRVKRQRSLDAVEALRDQLGSLLDAHQAGTQQHDR